MAEVSKEELVHIAKLASLNIKDDEIEQYRGHIENILNFVADVNSADVNELDITIGANEKYNAFRKDEVVEFENTDGLIENAPTKDRNMFKIPKVL